MVRSLRSRTDGQTDPLHGATGYPLFRRGLVLLRGAKIAHHANVESRQILKVRRREVGEHSGTIHQAPTRHPAVGCTITSQITEVRSPLKRKVADGNLSYLA